MLRTLLRRTGHVALGVPFVVMGWSGATTPGGRVHAAGHLGIPHPEAAVRFNGAAMVAGGLGLATGVLPRASALGLAASMVPTTLAGHAFWDHDDPKVRAQHWIHFLKNVGIVGGLIAVAAARGAGRD